MKKFGRVLVVSALVSSMIVTPVFAAPSVDELKENKSKAESEVGSLQTQLTSLMTKIDKLESDLITKGQEITKAEKDLKKAQKKQKQQYEDMKLRIKYMYEEGSGSYFQKLVESESLGDMLNQAEYMQEVHSYDRKKLQEYVETKDKIVTLKTTLEKDAKKIESMQSEYEKEESSLNNTIETKKSEIADFDTQIQAAAEAAAREAAERAAQRQQAAANHNSGSSNRGNSGGGSSGGSSGGSYTGSGNASKGQAIVSAAYGYMGVPYVWGGASSSGVDCSGLVMLAHRAVGISLSHSSGAQGGGGKAVSASEARPGDVVCYSGHVGIYVGGGKMIHAPHTGDVVRVASVYGSPWYRRYW